MIVDQPRMPRVIDAKHRALSRYVSICSCIVISITH
jgi:hypothetical protein